MALSLLARLEAEAAERTHAGAHPITAVLVVDDVEDARVLVAETLLQAGFLVRTAENGFDALIAASEWRPVVIVMDITMPMLDGIEATRLIKAGTATRDARVIAHTAKPGNAAIDVQRHVMRWCRSHACLTCCSVCPRGGIATPTRESLTRLFHADNESSRWSDQDLAGHRRVAFVTTVGTSWCRRLRGARTDIRASRLAVVRRGLL